MSWLQEDQKENEPGQGGGEGGWHGRREGLENMLGGNTERKLTWVLQARAKAGHAEQTLTLPKEQSGWFLGPLAVTSKCQECPTG